MSVLGADAGNRDAGNSVPQHEKDAVRDMMAKCQNNLAACQVQRKNWSRVVELCTEVIKLDSGASKAYFRRGTAYMNTGNLDRARDDFAQADRLVPGDKGIAQALAKVNLGISAERKKSDKAFRGMFNAAARADTDVPTAPSEGAAAAADASPHDGPSASGVGAAGAGAAAAEAESGNEPAGSGASTDVVVGESS